MKAISKLLNAPITTAASELLISKIICYLFAIGFLVLGILRLGTLDQKAKELIFCQLLLSGGILTFLFGTLLNSLARSNKSGNLNGNRDP